MDGATPPGAPGIPPRWTSSAKCGVGAALSGYSRVWFSLSHGILNEIYYPRVDQACVRDLGLIVTAGDDFFAEEKRHTDHQVDYLTEGAPAYRLTNTSPTGRFTLEKELFTDPTRDTLLQWTRFTPQQGNLAGYHLYALLAPHLRNRGAGNTAWVGDYKGTVMLFAEHDGVALALACSVGWLACSAGYVGFSDGWQDLTQHKRLTWQYTRAADGNVALTGEIDLIAGNGEFLLALGFGQNWAEAGQRALSSLQDGSLLLRTTYIRQWRAWQQSLLPLEEGEDPQHRLYRISMAVLRTHEAKRFPGGMIASLSVPWGFAKGDDNLGGYHLVWPRDLVETAGALLAAGAQEDIHRVLRYLQVTQEADGHWPQNMWLDGTPYWLGVQMDETAFPILLTDLAHRHSAVKASELPRFWPMVRRAASYITRNGPVTEEDRWEEDAGYSPFTLAVEIAALLAAADLAILNGEPAIATYLRETADFWNDMIEHWTYVTGSDLATQIGVDGYYVRIAPPNEAEASSPLFGYVPIKNRPPDESDAPAIAIVSPDALALVRFGLRAADDPRIRNTVRVIDALLKVETPVGPAWHRYNQDGYGEHDDGSPFDGSGIGRAWPLLTGERGHYELAAGRRDEATRLLSVLARFAGPGGMLPEQVWDSADLPEHELVFGQPAGSAMPLVWAHAEYIKLLRSLRDQAVFDMPPQPVQRYLVDKVSATFALWRFNHKCRTLPAGKQLRIEVQTPARVHWSLDNWQTVNDSETQPTGLGLHKVDLPIAQAPPSTLLQFTFYWLDDARWEGSDFAVLVR